MENYTPIGKIISLNNEEELMNGILNGQVAILVDCSSRGFLASISGGAKELLKSPRHKRYSEDLKKDLPKIFPLIYRFSEERLSQLTFILTQEILEIIRKQKYR